MTNNLYISISKMTINCKSWDYNESEGYIYLFNVNKINIAKPCKVR